MGPIKPPVQAVTEIRQLVCAADHLSHSVPRIRMRGAIFSLIRLHVTVII
jgi:hypothetical protein